MLEREEYDYLGVGLAVGLGLGLIGGIVGTVYYKTKKTLSADHVLETVKQAFIEEGPIEGSWIQFAKEPLQKFAIKSQTYTGGITRIEDAALVQYEFIADAHTGSVIDIYRL